MTPPADEWSMIEEAVSRLFGEVAAPGVHVRIGDRLAELGWSEIEAEYPVEAAALLFRAQGRSLAQTECLDAAIRAELPAVLTERVDAIVLPSLTHGAVQTADSDATGVVLGPAEGPHGRLAFVVRSATGYSLCAVETSEVRASPMNTFDPTVQWTNVTAPMPGIGVDVTAHWDRALAAAHRALATELIAVADEALATAVEHVGVRVQYGKAIGAMQSPRHALAEASARLEGARALLDASWRYGGVTFALATKAAAGRAHRGVADVALQVCGAIGLTHEHRLHRYVSRGLQLDALCGSAQQLETQLANALFAPDSVDDGLPVFDVL